jgi:hypothetical protein
VRALVIHPVSDYNIGDLLTYVGAQEILRAVNPDIEFIFFDMHRAERELSTYTTQFYWGQVDLIVLAGSPWIWFNLEQSPKYKILLEAIEQFSSAKKIALGIGSCFPLRSLDPVKTYNEMLFYSESVPILRTVFTQFDLVLTRDSLAQAILNLASVPSLLSEDTSWWARNHFTRRVRSDRSLCIYQDPTFCLSKGDLSDDYIHEFMETQLDFIRYNDAEVFAISAEDTFSANAQGFEARYVADLEWMAAHISERPQVLSGRVHMGVLAKIMGSTNISVLPLDSRVLTLDVLKGIDVRYDLAGRVALGEAELLNNTVDISGDEVVKKLQSIIGR